MKIIGVDYEDGEVKDIHVTTDGENRIIFTPLKHGNWYWEGYDVYQCDSCHTYVHVEESMCRPAYKFCPYCGASMNGIENE